MQLLLSLSNTTHQVITAVGFLQKHKWECIHEISEVTFGPLSKTEIQNYIETGSPMDKAGAYGIQDSFGTLNIRSISGSYTNIIGLPVTQVLEKIKEIIQVQ
jgi:septum formation protein